MTAEPKRVQRKRLKGWKTPPNTVYVGRGSKWGNPFRSAPPHSAVSLRHGNSEALVWVLDKEIAVLAFRLYLKSLDANELVAQARRELRGKNLACWCGKEEHCHADVWLQIVNEKDESQ